MSHRKKHVLVVTSEFPPQPGGIGRHAYNLAFYLTKENYEVSVLADQRSVEGIEESNFDSSLPFHVKRIKLNKFRWFMYINRLVKRALRK